MKNKFYFFIIILNLSFLLIGCDSNPKLENYDASPIKIVVVGELKAENENEVLRVPESVRTLCDTFDFENKKFKRTYVLDPTLYRLDNAQELSLKTDWNGSFSGNPNNAKIAEKLIQKNFNKIEVPKAFNNKRVDSVNTNIALEKFINDKATQDSIFVFNDDGKLNSYKLNNHPVRIYKDMDELRKKIKLILVENEKATFTVILNPPTLKQPLVVVKGGSSKEEGKDFNGGKRGGASGGKHGGSPIKNPPLPLKPKPEPVTVTKTTEEAKKGKVEKEHNKNQD